METLNIRTKFLTIFAIITLGILSLSFFGLFSFKKLEQYTTIQTTIEILKSDMLTLRRNEKDFLVRKDTKYLDKFKHNVETLYTHANTLKTLLQDHHYKTEDVNQFINIVTTYEKYFFNFASLQKQIGLHPNDQLFAKIKKQQAIMEKHFDIPTLQEEYIGFLKLHKNIDLFNTYKAKEHIEAFYTNLNTMHAMLLSASVHDKSRSLEDLRLYEEAFTSLVTLESQKGLNEKRGFHGKMRDTIHKTETLHASMSEKYSALTAGHIESLKKQLYTVMAIVMFIGLLSSIIFSRNMTSNIKKLETGLLEFFKYLNKEKTETTQINIQSNDEIGLMAKMINQNIDKAFDMLQNERKAADIIHKMNQEIIDTQKELINTVGTISETRSKETGLHVKRVAKYSRLFAQKLKLPLKEIELIELASPMHDIGKIGIPDNILNKPGKLTEAEFEVMKTHAQIGFDMLKHSQREILQAAAVIAYEHHEKYNGKGYPNGRSGESIHIFGRITAIADVFDALGSDRCYKKAWPLEKILNLIKEERGEHFDPKLVDIFFENLDEFLEIRAKYAEPTIETQESPVLLS